MIGTVWMAALAASAPLATSARDKAQPSAASSAGPSSSPASSGSPGKSVRALAFHGMISSVDKSAKTFTILSKQGSHVVKFTEKTVVTKDGSNGTVNDLVANMEVQGEYSQKADGLLEAKSVKIGTNAEKKKEVKKRPSPLPSASAKP